MKILVDTSYWSIVFRRKHPDENEMARFNDIIENEELYVTGIIIQELLSHITNDSLYNKIENIISGIGYIEPEIEDYLLASKLCNSLKSHGVSASTIDLLISSIAIRRNMHLLSKDNDYLHISKYSKLKLLNE